MSVWLGPCVSFLEEEESTSLYNNSMMMEKNPDKMQLPLPDLN